MKEIRGKIGKSLVLWLSALLLLAILATPALSTLFAAPGSVNTKATVNGAVTSKKIKNGTIKNGDIAAGAAIAAAKISTSGTLTAGGYAYKSVKTGHLAIPGAALFPTDSSKSYLTFGSARYSDTAGVVEFVAPVYLPQGANVTSFTMRAYDDSADDETASLHSVISGGAIGSMADVSTSGSSAGCGLAFVV